MNGGYILIDCTGLDLTKGSTAHTITGLYKKVADCMQKNKPLYCVNAVWGNYGKITPIGCFANKSSTDDIIVTSSTLQIIVTSSDVVTINNLVSKQQG